MLPCRNPGGELHQGRDRMVAITPLTLDMTARVSFQKLEEMFKTKVIC
jgi:broad specificity polyphosphatase/5'/3'-nucleotidase SurE